MDFQGILECVLPNLVTLNLWEVYQLWLQVTACLLISFIWICIELPLVILFRNWDLSIEIIAFCLIDIFFLPHFRGVWNTYVVPNLPRMQVYRMCEHPGGGLCLLTRRNNLGRWTRAVKMLYHPLACDFAWVFCYVVVRVLVHHVMLLSLKAQSQLSLKATAQ